MLLRKLKIDKLGKFVRPDEGVQYQLINTIIFRRNPSMIEVEICYPMPGKVGKLYVKGDFYTIGGDAHGEIEMEVDMDNILISQVIVYPGDLNIYKYYRVHSRKSVKRLF